MGKKQKQKAQDKDWFPNIKGSDTYDTGGTVTGYTYSRNDTVTIANSNTEETSPLTSYKKNNEAILGTARNGFIAGTIPTGISIGLELTDTATPWGPVISMLAAVLIFGAAGAFSYGVAHQRKETKSSSAQVELDELTNDISGASNNSNSFFCKKPSFADFIANPTVIKTSLFLAACFTLIGIALSFTDKDLHANTCWLAADLFAAFAALSAPVLENEMRSESSSSEFGV